MKKFDMYLPIPILFDDLYGGEHYPTLKDIIDNKKLMLRIRLQ
jgi:hypothetical protein